MSPSVPVLIVNPQSAGGKTRRTWTRIEASIRSVLGDVRPLFTERPGHATELTRGALREGTDLVIAMGGDGTINEVVNGFFPDSSGDGSGSDESRRAPISPGASFATLTAGTGGDFIKTTGTPRVLLDAVRGIAAQRARPRKIDVGRLEFLAHDGSRRTRHFINVASFGISGLVDRYVNQSSKSLGGKASFYLGTLRAGLSYKNARVRLTVDGKTEEKAYYVVAVSNGRYFGGGMMIAPDAAYDDGRFDVIAISDVNMATMVMNASTIYNGTHLKLPFVTSARGTRVEAESSNGEEVLLDIDGEQPGRLPATFELLPGAIQVVA